MNTRTGSRRTLATPPTAVSESPLEDVALQSESLEALTGAPNYQRWLADLATPILGDHALELGSGTGDYSALWLAHGATELTLTEIEPSRMAILERRFADDPRVHFRTIDLHQPPTASYSSMVSFNVLEHIEDDVAALSSAQSLLHPGGAVLHVVPAFPALMSDFDREIGHYRRYTRSEMIRKATAAGLVDVDVRYMNAPGTIAWFVMMRALKKRPLGGRALTFWDGVVVRSERRIESVVKVPFGQSVVLRARTRS